MRKLSEKQKEEAFARYVDGESSTSIAKDYDISSQALCGLMHRNGIKVRTNAEAHQQIQINRLAFSKATADALYWAGFLMADGAITGKIPSL